MNRNEAMALLKELIAHDLVEPSWVSIEERRSKHFQIQIKCDYNCKQIEQFVKKNNLIVEEDKEKRYLLIHRP